jgi:tetratricopeptide (TPR) repeat protein
MLQSRLAKRPNDRNLLVQMVEEAEAEGDFLRARKNLRTLLDSGHALAVDYNAFAWLSLFGGTADAKAVEAAQQANLLSNGDGFAELHTLACIYAAQGKTTEARQLLLQAMSSGKLVEPNGPIWFGFGLIYEQYGVRDAAISAYKRVQKPEGWISPIDVFMLAQIRLQALGAK